VFGEYPFTFAVVGDAPVEAARQPTTNYQIVSASYFSTLDLAIVAGRNFDPRDTPTSPRVAIVNEALARSLGGRNPIGLQVAVAPVDSPNDKPAIVEIVGVAKQVKQRPDETTDFIQLYAPLGQDLVGDIMLMVRSQTDRASALAPSVRAVIENIDRSQTTSVASVTTLAEVEWAATGRHRFRAVMVSAFAALAVILAMVGVFGILAYSVQQRVRDFGVRRALGATSNDVMRLVVGDAIKVIAIGAAIGLVLSAMLGRMIVSMLFGVQPLDVTTFALVIGVLSLTAAVSVAGPAWRAARIDPAQALRSK
jgi:ABC-type antimicrobial peptide transport system permease subunit